MHVLASVPGTSLPSPFSTCFALSPPTWPQPSPHRHTTPRLFKHYTHLVDLHALNPAPHHSHARWWTVVLQGEETCQAAGGLEVRKSPQGSDLGRSARGGRRMGRHPNESAPLEIHGLAQRCGGVWGGIHGCFVTDAAHSGR